VTRPEPSEVEAVTLEVASVLEKLGIASYVGGSVASSLLGIPRFTQDIDFVADVRAEHVGPLVAALEKDYYVDASLIEAALRRRGSFNVAHLPTMVKVDVFVARRDPFSVEEMKRRRRLRIGAGAADEVWVASPEDIVLQKLRWFDESGRASDHQVRDVVGVLQVQAGRLDESYLDSWAARLDLTDLLGQARALAAPR
jgi:hypothetical protein